MGQRALVCALMIVAPVLAVYLPLGDQQPVLHPAPTVWRTASLGRPGPAAHMHQANPTREGSRRS